MDSHYQSNDNEVHQQVKPTCDIHLNILKEKQKNIRVLNTTAD